MDNIVTVSQSNLFPDMMSCLSCVVSLQLSEHLGISMELGCFVAGVVLSSNGEHLVHQVSINILLTDRNTFL